MKTRSQSDCQLNVVPQSRPHLAATRRNRSHNDVLVPHSESPRRSCLKRSSSNNTFNAEDSEDILLQQNSSASISTNIKPKSLRKNVSFHTIDIAEHAYELGDNPSCAGGAPIQIGWEPMDKIQLEVDEYEREKPHRRNKDQLKLPALIRDHLARSSGASRADVKKATKEAQRVSKSRYKSLKQQPWDDLHYKLEKTTRTLRKATSIDGLKRLGKSSSNNSLHQWSTGDLEALDSDVEALDEPNKAAAEELSEETVDTNEEYLQVRKHLGVEEPLCF
ncbi:MAG: hypothetical protein SGILL_003146 [Bacillariaceae sp.]